MKIQDTFIENGTRVVSVAMPELRTASFVASFAGGSCEEQGAAEMGVAHFLEHMIFKGTPTRSALAMAREIEITGSDTNAYTAKDHTAYYGSGLGDHIGTLSAVIGDALCHSLFRPEDIATEVEVVQQEIRRKLDNAWGLAFDHFAALAFPDHPLGRPVLGTMESVAAFTPETIRGFVRRQYARDNLLVIASGAVDHGQVCDLVSRDFATLPEFSERTSPPHGEALQGVVRVDTSRPFEQVTLLGGYCLPWSVRDRLLCEVLTNALGGGMASPIFQEVREKRGLAYACGANTHLQAGQMKVGVYVGTSKQQVTLALRVVGDVLNGVARTGIDAKDFERAVNNALVSRARTLEGAHSMGWFLLDGLHTEGEIVTPDDEIAALRSITKDEVDDLAARLFSRDPALVLIGPVEDADHLAMWREGGAPAV